MYDLKMFQTYASIVTNIKVLLIPLHYIVIIVDNYVFLF